MLILLGLALIAIPAVAILYPFLRRPDSSGIGTGDRSTQAKLSQHWERAIEGLRNTELDWSIGNLTEDDYQLLREQYMTDAAVALKAIEELDSTSEAAPEGDGECDS